MKKLWRFKGGIKLLGFKKLSTASSIQKLAIPKRIILPLRQHIGAVAEPVVTVGDKVYKGQLVATSNSFISAPVHASSSGTIIEIDNYNIPHHSGITEMCIVIDTDGVDEWHPDIKLNPNPEKLSADELRNCIRDAGIVGLGGAVFPSAAKLKPTRTIDTLIINGVECEPYITCDDALMRARPENIIRGILLLRKLLQPVECIIAIEDNKPEAIRALETALEKLKTAGIGSVNTIKVIAVPTVFPTGGEKQLIKVLTGKEVPQHGLPYEVGIVCMNVGTTAAVYDAVYTGVPLISRLVTVTGPQIKQPANFEVLIGTPVDNILAEAGGVVSKNYSLIMGGPMMGMSLPNSSVPVVKACNCILVESTAAQKQSNAMPCIRCGACARVCPMQLLPQQLYWHSRSKAFSKLEHYNLSDCIECGCCSIVCPSKIPLVHYFRYAKTEKIAHEVKAKFADQSRVRTQVREARLERIKCEQEERKAKRKADRKKKQKKKMESKIKDEDGDNVEKKQISAG